MKARWLGLVLCAVWISSIPALRALAEDPNCPEVAEKVQQALLDLNLASLAELESLPGIGPAKAQAIVAFRDARGGFTSVNQLLRIKGIGRAMLRKLAPLVTVSSPTTQKDINRVR